MNTLPFRRIKAAVSHPLPLLAAGVIHTLSQDATIDVAPLDERDADDVDVVITDHSTALTLASGYAGRHPREARAKLAVIASAGRETEVHAALAAGVQGYLLAGCSAHELVQCVRVLSAGSRYLTRAAMQCIADSLSHEKLTPREAVVLAHMAEGMGNKVIAHELGICLGTVKSHVKKILEKLGATNRTQAISVATSRGLLGARPARPTLAGPARTACLTADA